MLTAFSSFRRWNYYSLAIIPVLIGSEFNQSLRQIANQQNNDCSGLVYNDRVWDPLKQQHYRWREISLESERVDIYRPGAAYCIRSLSVVTKLALAAQQCCYDQRRRLLTRGWATGTPALVSPEASLHLSRVTERIPWLACKGDFSRSIPNSLPYQCYQRQLCICVEQTGLVSI